MREIFTHRAWNSRAGPPLGQSNLIYSAARIANTARPYGRAKRKRSDGKNRVACKRRGFIFQSSEIYGGINGFWDYGPLGAEAQAQRQGTLWNTHDPQRDDVAGLEATIIMHPQIWKASGHVDTFSDPMVDCKTCKGRFRADQPMKSPARRSRAKWFPSAMAKRPARAPST